MPVPLGEIIRTTRLSMRPRPSQDSVARAVGVSRITVNSWECGRSKPSYSDFRKLQSVLPLNLGTYDEAVTKDTSSDHKPVAAVVNPFLDGMRVRVPVYRTVLANISRGEADFYVGEEIVTHVTLPQGMSGRGSLRMIRVRGNRMSPRYNENEVIIVGGDREPTAGDYVLIVLKKPVPSEASEDGAVVRSAMVRQLVGVWDKHLMVARLHPTVAKSKILRADIHTIERVVPLEELVGS